MTVYKNKMTRFYSNTSEVPLALAVFLASDSYDYNEEPYTISATTLIKPVRQIVLATRVPEGMALPKLADMMRSRMGTAIHDGIEKAWKTNYQSALSAIGIPSKVIERVKINPELEDLDDETIPVYMEQRLTKQVDKWKVTGKFDFVGEGKVQDFKSTSVYTYINQVNATKYGLQGSIYRWLDPVKITEDQMDIHYIFTDWKSNMAKTNVGYPQRSFLTQTYDLMSLKETDAYVKNKLQEIDKYMDADEADIPYCTDEDLWRSTPVYKYYKNRDITAKRSTKNFSTYREAAIYMASNGGAGAIKEVPGQVVACKYCPAFSICSQKDELLASGDLTMD